MYVFISFPVETSIMSILWTAAIGPRNPSIVSAGFMSEAKLTSDVKLHPHLTHYEHNSYQSIAAISLLTLR